MAANGASQGFFFQAIGIGGGIYFQSDNVFMFDRSATQLALTYALNGVGATSAVVAAAVTSWAQGQAPAASGTGASHTYQAQDVTTGTGGDFKFGAGGGSVASGNLEILHAKTATTATAGSSGAAPALVAGYLIVKIAGTLQKIPYYNV